MIVPLYRCKFMSLAVSAIAVFCINASAAKDATPEKIVTTLRIIYGVDGLRYFSNNVDLNGDGKAEIVVYPVGPGVCGSGGCDLLVFSPQESGYRLVSTISVTQPPVHVAKDKTSGWRDLQVGVGGGGAKASLVQLSFNGKTYPTNPTVSGPLVRSIKSADGKALIEKFSSMEEAQVLATNTAKSSIEVATIPSFDCEKATNAVEKLVCTNKALAALDKSVADEYRLGVSASSEWTDSDKEAERQRQRGWIKARNACSKETKMDNCVTAAYQKRLIELQIRNGKLTSEAPVEYRCKGREDTPVSVAYYAQTNPPAAVVTVGNRQTITFATQTASGARYTAAGVDLWEHHGEATLKWYGTDMVCRAP
ncbi:MliC family protein [Noviherbaspirillum saxi]|uniref:C-type lysozyme inhibitor domain-containing protein n=1 Tax=Noviherbaspirillum saxi TaxID=2320863 RepID=A0A3A3FRG4_9BURK|nr:MliC family protein [Noviherbaspirillum saxi]RJF97834.1 hypothetical protein D3871_04325 [Noviherbaspirillum saxi]